VKRVWPLQEFVYDLKGMRFNQVLVRRGTPTWCDSWGHSGSYWGVDGLTTVSMGIAMGTEEYCYHNGERGKYGHTPRHRTPKACRSDIILIWHRRVDLQATSSFRRLTARATREPLRLIRRAVPARKAFHTLVSTSLSPSLSRVIV
jgi:hypothetical protein